ncbi:GTPase-activating protein [Tilletia horrida]|uniref:GTPase-activating protein n=1 Tax=Tilletia horrida TaxID=155126 RepID=A0AAN6JRJ4_9BASI|nr:GTPase-activating protein [Tilletia horrida]
MSSSSTSAAAASASTPTSSGPKHPHWEDEAWTVDSDDEDFVCRQQQQHFASSSSIASRKHRHPHPPLPRQSSTSSSSSFTSTSAHVRPGPTPHLNSRTSWLLVDSVPSSSSTPIPTTSSGAAASRTAVHSLQSNNTADLDAAIAGSPPTDLGPSAEAAVYNASFLGSSSSQLPSTPGTTNSASSAVTTELHTTTVSPLTRVPSSRTRRRWTEFVKALGGITPPSPAQAIAATVSPSSSSSSTTTNGAAAAATKDSSDVNAITNEFSTSLSISSPTSPSVPTAVNLDELRKAAWKGVPDELRPMVWQLLLGYLPPQPSARSSTLARKRSDYAAAVDQAFGKGRFGLDQSIWHQIEIDVPRTNPGIPLWQREATQRSLERILYVWALRHPASGYVQGIADLATPFYEVFLGAYIDSDPEQYDVAHLPAQTLQALEADTFWCLSKLLDGIQDNYIFAQPGIQRQVKLMGELVARIDAPLHQHLAEQNVQYMQFAFRWMNCLLMREMSVRNIVRMWDTYLAEGPDSFADFHPFVCAGLLRKWSSRLLEMDFQGIIMFLQNLPTKDWSNSDAEDLLAQAFM